MTECSGEGHPGIVFRRALPEDASQIADRRVDLLRETGFLSTEAPPDPLRQAVLDYLHTAIPSGDFTGWVADRGGLLVSVGGLVLFRKPPLDGNLSGLEAYVLNMYTVSEWRGKGLATRLLQELVEHARTTGATRVRLHASELGAPIYRKAGFAQSATEMVLKLPVT